MSPSPIIIERTTDLPADEIAPLVAESEARGWKFVRRLAVDFASGFNRYDRPGEGLWVARAGGKLVGVCGLGIDPYGSDTSIGRIRRLYVLAAYRGQGIGRQLVQTAIAAARGHFRKLRLRTESRPASRLYEQLGFRPVEGDKNCTHELDFATQAPLHLGPRDE